VGHRHAAALHGGTFLSSRLEVNLKRFLSEKRVFSLLTIANDVDDGDIF